MTLQKSWIGNWDINHLKSKLPNPNSWHWEHTPSWSDPRLPVLGILALYIVLGITVLGFNRSPVKILLIISSAWLIHECSRWLKSLTSILTLRDRSRLYLQNGREHD